MDKTDKIFRLIEEMKHDAEDWQSEEDVDLEKKYSQCVQDLGAQAVVNILFRHYQDSTNVSALMGHLFFIWKDFHYQDWKELFYSFVVDKVDRYHFEWFCQDVLEIDVKRLIKEDKQLSKLVKPQISEGPLGITLVETSEPGSPWTQEMFREHGMEAIEYWRRLKEEGAPMRIDI
jgi:hypothetical protein